MTTETTDTRSLPRWKPCPGCGERKPLDDFRRVHAGRDWQRHHECNTCRNRREREKRRRRRLRTTKKLLHLLAKEKRLERIEVVLNKLLCECGGRRRFGATLGELVRTGSPVDRRHTTNAIINLIGLVDAERRRLDARMRGEETARASLSDPGMREACVQLLLEEMWRWPSHVTRAAASICPDDAIDSLIDICPEKIADRLTAAGWAVTRPKTKAP